ELEVELLPGGAREAERPPAAGRGEGRLHDLVEGYAGDRCRRRGGVVLDVGGAGAVLGAVVGAGLRLLAEVAAAGGESEKRKNERRLHEGSSRRVTGREAGSAPRNAARHFGRLHTRGLSRNWTAAPVDVPDEHVDLPLTPGRQSRSS